MARTVQASRKVIKTLPVRIVVEVFWWSRRDPDITDKSQRVKVRGIVDLSLRVSDEALPMWFVSEVEVFPDLTAEIKSFGPAYGTIGGGEILMEQLLHFYQDAFSRALVSSNLSIIGVK